MSDGPFMPGAPIGDRVKNYEYGHAVAKHIAESGKAREDLVSRARDASKEVDARKAEYDAIARRRSEAIAKGDKEGASKAAKDLKESGKQWWSAMERREKMAPQLEAAEKREREIVREALKAKDPVEFRSTHAANLSAEQKHAATEASDYVRSITEKSGASNMAEVHHEPISPLVRERAHFQPDTAHGVDSIRSDSRDSTSTHVHEYGHYLEKNLPGAKEAASQFLEHRVGKEASTDLAAQFPTRGYQPGEKGRRDRFDEAFGESAHYVGKDYGGRATEILSMGIEAMHRDPVNFCKKDPEYAAFVIGVLKGHLRGGQS